MERRRLHSITSEAISFAQDFIVKTHDLGQWDQTRFQGQKGSPSYGHNLWSVRARGLDFCSQLRGAEYGVWEEVEASIWSPGLCRPGLKP